MIKVPVQKIDVPSIIRSSEMLLQHLLIFKGAVFPRTPLPMTAVYPVLSFLLLSSCWGSCSVSRIYDVYSNPWELGLSWRATCKELCLP